MSLYVVQEHRARSHHFDLRLERDGVLKSWALPKGMPLEPGIRRLAIEVEDHALEFGSFEGRIPEGEYGAGTIEIWDRGEFDAIEWTADTIVVEIRAGRVSGRYALVRFAKGGDNAWLLFKRSDPAAPPRPSP